MVFSGEFHPFRLPVPGLWLDVFQKIKSMGFNGVSFYTDWGLLEANPGNVMIGDNGVNNNTDIWNLDEFFAAASEAGIYLIARPGPYINAETSAGGIPGWVLRIKGVIRSISPDYVASIKNYMSKVGKIIADAQITRGGPVIMVQPENEYTTWPGLTEEEFPSQMNRAVMALMAEELRAAGVDVPMAMNDNEVEGYFAPGTGLGEVDIYGIDAYPMRYDCAHPDVWPTYRFPYDWNILHEEQSPSTPFTIMEFQGGGGVTEEGCAMLVNHEASRVVYKNNYSFGVKIFNIYMTYGGTNWGNLGYHGGYTSYDYGASIAEDRTLTREKYSEQKLQANFFKISPAYLTATPGIGKNGSYTDNPGIAVTPLVGNGTETNFYVVRHADFTFTGSARYRLTVSTSIGNVTIPQLHNATLSLNGRDSKLHVTDYDVGGINMIYSSAEVLTWAHSLGSTRVLVLYGGQDEVHEIAFSQALSKPVILDGPVSGIVIRQLQGSWVIQWRVTATPRVIQMGDLELHLLWRNDAYNYWILEPPAVEPIGNYSSPSKDLIIVKAGYLVRTAIIQNNLLVLSGDLNATTAIEVISTPQEVHGVVFNDQLLNTTLSSRGKLHGLIQYNPPTISLPTPHDLEWRYLDSLPEIGPSYDDEAWTVLNQSWTNNPRNLTTPTSLYALDYGYHTGSLLYRGHFIANGQESFLFLNISGGAGFGYSIWLNDKYLDSWTGSSDSSFYAQNISLVPTANLISLSLGKPYTISILIDHMGYDEEAPGTDAIKFPRGILDYSLSGHEHHSDLRWKMTGNLGGEQYYDLIRGPLNEGAMFAERQGYHLPSPPSNTWEMRSPFTKGIEKPGVGFFTTSFPLDLPTGYDIPLRFVFAFNGSTDDVHTRNYRCQLYVNGFQFGKFVNNLGPQTDFPVPEGILNYNGINYIAVTLWGLDGEAMLGPNGLQLVASRPIWSGYRKPVAVEWPGYVTRRGAY
ncbi:putative beta-galactosidase [Aspergillus bombycis]|uniref:Beta-galactosidase n=1 Tax=Aspergillus bombycis TaxID=109264 RepID=A0A1F7ZP50_9EURO|nr:putative beta-galactosidase [Aspergillus bombycis]OGM40835.1 putative beta-galactosidase [Aspergillus bombycis]